MAGDWIKMRVNLVTHPKVIALSERLSHEGGYQDWSGLAGFIPAIGGTHEDFEEGVMQALRVTRYVAVTALLRFWGYAHEHAKDEFIANLRVADIDEITQVPGFGAALESIGWAVYDEKRKGTLLPNFNEHNAVAKDRGAAERQKRYRERIKERDVIGDVTRDVTRNYREEKRREEVNLTSMSGKPDPVPHKGINGFKPQAIEVLNFLNTKTGRNYQPVEANLKLIAARLKEGASVSDCRAVVAKKAREWGTDEKMEQYLRPATLFNATKFAQYRGELVEAKDD